MTNSPTELNEKTPAAVVPFDVSKRGRSFYLGVSLTALLVIFYETVAFQTLIFVADYMRAVQVIAIALVGISIGGYAAFALRHRASYALYMRVSMMLPFTVAIAFLSLCVFPADPWVYSVCLMLPFACASTVISMTFALAPSHVVYFYDLTGAAVGALAACIAVPNLREEGSFLAIMLVGFLATFVFARNEESKRSNRFQNISLVGFGIVAVLIVSNLFLDYLNMAYIVRKTDEGPAKLYNYCKRDDGSYCDLRYSKGSLVERIDIVKQKPGRAPCFYNGYPNDHISSNKTSAYKNDKRLANGLVKNPDVLVIGTAAEGVTKTAKAITEGAVVGLEINPAIVRAMTKKFYKFSANAYEDIELHVIDARSYFHQTDRKFDIITMMNTHRMRNVGYAGQPEYLHTTEALKDIFDHLTDGGWLVLEEREVNERAKWGIRRFIQNVKYVLADDFHSADPAQHFWIYDWWGNDRIREGNRYTQIYIKKTPVNEEDKKFFVYYEAERNKKKSYGAIPRYKPGVTTDTDVEKLLLADSPYRVFDKAKFNFERITDDKPFPFDVTHERPHVTMIMKPTVILAILLGLIPAIVLLAWHGYSKRKEGATFLSHNFYSGVAIAYFSLLGIGYMMIEIVFMQKLQIFLGVPVLTMATVIGTMLFFSGLGSYLSGNWPVKIQAAAFVGIVVLALAYLPMVNWLIDHLTYLHIAVRIPIVILMLAPLAFLMGTPFPFGMKAIKERLDDRFAAAMFGLNGAFSALSTPVALTLGMYIGFTKSFQAGTAVYALCMVFAAILGVLSRRKA